MNVQALRFLDVLLLGPWLLWVGTRRHVTATDRTLLVLVGWGTIMVNGALWLRERDGRQ